MGVVLDVRDLHVTYAGAVRALAGVSLEVPEGAVVAVLGNNGAGKSTLLRAVSGTLRGQRGAITGGSIELAGRSLIGLDPADVARAGLVQVPEGRRIFARLSVEENLDLGGGSLHPTQLLLSGNAPAVTTSTTCSRSSPREADGFRRKPWLGRAAADARDQPCDDGGPAAAS